MPELVEVEVVRLNMTRWMHGRRVQKLDILRPQTVKQGDGIPLSDIFNPRAELGFYRKGKALLAHNAQNQRGAIFRFAMTGKVVAEERVGAREKARIRIHLDGAGPPALVFLDARNLGSITTLKAPSIAEALDAAVPGRDMWLDPPDIDAWMAMLKTSRRAIKPWLMEQTQISGIGNILATELLFRAGISPHLPANALGRPQAQRLLEAAHPLLSALIQGEMADEIVYFGEKGAVNPFDIYGRAGKGCPRCAHVLEKVVLGGRGTVFCPSCQAS